MEPKLRFGRTLDFLLHISFCRSQEQVPEQLLRLLLSRSAGRSFSVKSHQLYFPPFACRDIAEASQKSLLA
jgi:hypothetical protein